MSPDVAADEAEALLENGFRAVKLRLGRGGIGLELAAVRPVRKRLPDRVTLMVDFNQALTFSNAMQYGAARDEERVYWIEEPIRHDDYRHLALLGQAVKTPIQIGENFAGLAPVATALEPSASDYVMLDLDRIGGVTGWQRAAGLAAANNREVSSRLFPEVSVHLLAATPGRHWREYVIGQCRSSRSHCKSSTAWRLFPTARVTECCGTKRPSPNSSSIEKRWRRKVSALDA